jgi:hypothetical protein
MLATTNPPCFLRGVRQGGLIVTRELFSVDFNGLLLLAPNLFEGGWRLNTRVSNIGKGSTKAKEYCVILWVGVAIADWQIVAKAVTKAANRLDDFICFLNLSGCQYNLFRGENRWRS